MCFASANVVANIHYAMGVWDCCGLACWLWSVVSIQLGARAVDLHAGHEVRIPA